MSHTTLPRLFMRSRCGKAADRTEPSFPKLLLFYVVPLSLLPPLMCIYGQLMHPGLRLLSLESARSHTDILLVSAAFFMLELLAVALMAMFIQQLGETVDVVPSYAQAFALAATAPTPLWLSTLGLALPSLWLNLGLLILAWLACGWLIRRGVKSLFTPYDDSRTHRLANTLTLISAATWAGLILFLVLLLSITVGWR